MATTFYLRTANIGIATYNNFASLERGATVTNISATTTASATWISIGFWSTMPLASFTLLGTVTMNFWGFESVNQVNASLGMRIYRWQYNNGSPTLSASLGQASSVTELATGTGGALRTATVTPTTTVFNTGDIIVIEAGAVNTGTMGAGTVTLRYNGPTAAAAGDTFFSIDENVEDARPYVQVT